MPSAWAAAPLTLTAASVPEALPLVPPVTANVPAIGLTLTNWSEPKSVALNVRLVPLADAVTPVTALMLLMAVAIEESVELPAKLSCWVPVVAGDLRA